MNYDENLDPLIQVALIHYQFETTHPFLDGNGRVGRLLITLFLIERKILSTPVLYISYYLKMNRIEYYDQMTQIRRTGDYEQWVEFFLQAFSTSAEDAITTINKMTKLHNSSIHVIKNNISDRQQGNILKLFEYIEKNPIIDIQKTANALSLSYNTVNSGVKQLIKNNILTETERTGKSKIYAYNDYLDILR